MEKEEKEQRRKKKSKALRKGSISSVAQGHDLSRHQNGQEFANLSHRFSGNYWDRHKVRGRRQHNGSYNKTCKHNFYTLLSDNAPEYKNNWSEEGSS